MSYIHFSCGGHKNTPEGFIYGHLSSVQMTTHRKTSTNSTEGICVVDFNNDSDVDSCGMCVDVKYGIQTCTEQLKLLHRKTVTPPNAC